MSDPQDDQATTTQRRGVLITPKQLIAIALVLAVGAGVAVGVLVTGGGSSKHTSASGSSEVFLESVNSSGHSPFTPNVGNDHVPSSSASTTTSTRAPGSTVAIPAYRGDTVGLYGGTHRAGSCDPAQLVGFLEQNPSKAAAWAAVLGIRTSEIRSYVSTLTPVILRSDTRVTNHGFVNGRATNIPAVLQAGTAVMVNRYGQPVVKCYCGNPLTAPRALARPTYTGRPWSGFEPTGVTVVVQTTVVINTFTLVDVETGQPFTRPAGTAGQSDGNLGTPTSTPTSTSSSTPPDTSSNTPPSTPPSTGPAGQTLGTGAVQVTLTWASTADLDLHVIDPSGVEISYGQRSSPSGGQLDVDSNGSCNNLTSSPVENIFWPSSGAPAGDYTVKVNYFGECPPATGPQNFTLTIRLNGQVTDQRTGSITPSDTQEVTHFTVASG